MNKHAVSDHAYATGVAAFTIAATPVLQAAEELAQQLTGARWDAATQGILVTRFAALYVAAGLCAERRARAQHVARARRARKACAQMRALHGLLLLAALWCRLQSPSSGTAADVASCSAAHSAERGAVAGAQARADGLYSLSQGMHGAPPVLTPSAPLVPSASQRPSTASPCDSVAGQLQNVVTLPVAAQHLATDSSNSSVHSYLATGAEWSCRRAGHGHMMELEARQHKRSRSAWQQDGTAVRPQSVQATPPKLQRTSAGRVPAACTASPLHVCAVGKRKPRSHSAPAGQREMRRSP